jgi:putative effector of murein hydrolase
MALPVWQKRVLIGENWRMFTAVIGASLILSVGTVLAVTPVLGSDMARALAVKSVTAPVALGIGSQTGLRQDLVVIGVMTSGLFGMLIGPALLMLSRSGRDHSVIGVALGCASHGLGTARAFEISQTAGAFASVCMGFSALTYGILLPFVLEAI